MGDAAWSRVADLKTANGKVYHVDPATGVVTFGDGIHGDIPPAGSVITATYRARRSGFVDYYAAMKKIDASIQIFAGYESPKLISTLGAAHLYDGIVIHPYTNEYNIPKATGLEDWHQSLMLSSARLGGVIAAYQSLIDQTVAPERRGKVKIVCTEYGPNRQEAVLPASLGQGNHQFLSAGLYQAAQLLQWMRLGLPHAQRHATTVGVFGPPPEFAPTPSAEVFKVFSQHFGDRLIGVGVRDNPSVITDTVLSGNAYHGGIIRADAPRAPQGAPRLKLPLLEVEASRDAKGNLYVIVLNQSTRDPVRAQLEIAGTHAPGPAQIWTLSGSAPNSFNTPKKPDAVKLLKSKRAAGPGTSTYDFAPLSLTAIRLEATSS